MNSRFLGYVLYTTVIAISALIVGIPTWGSSSQFFSASRPQPIQPAFSQESIAQSASETVSKSQISDLTVDSLLDGLKKAQINVTLDSFFDTTVAGLSDHKAQTLLDELCESSVTCNKIVVQGDMSIQNRLFAVALIEVTINRMDQLLISSSKIKNALKAIYLSNDSHEVRHCDSGIRGCSSHSVMEFDLSLVESKEEFYQVLVHELGHLIDLGVLKGKNATLDTRYTEFGKPKFGSDDVSLGFYSLSWKSETIKSMGVSYEDFVGGYAMTNPFEDFAESVNLYLNHQAQFAEYAKTNTVMKKKYLFMRKLFGGKVLRKQTKTVQTLSDFRAWDSTRG
jgi:hypothetical protein